MRAIILIVLVLVSFGCKQSNSSDKSLNQTENDSLIRIHPAINIDKPALKIDTFDFEFSLDSKRTFSDYKKNISQVKTLLENNITLSDNIVESIIPTSQEEYSYYYSLTYTTEEDWLFFQKIDALIISKCEANVGNCIELYSNLAEFVDGEYAEGFYSNIYFIIEKNPAKFCDVYDNLSLKSKMLLTDNFNEFCKGIKPNAIHE